MWQGSRVGLVATTSLLLDLLYKQPVAPGVPGRYPGASDACRFLGPGARDDPFPLLIFPELEAFFLCISHTETQHGGHSLGIS